LNYPDLSGFLVVTCIKLLGPFLLTTVVPTKIYKTKAGPANRLLKFQKLVLQSIKKKTPSLLIKSPFQTRPDSFRSENQCSILKSSSKEKFIKRLEIFRIPKSPLEMNMR